MMLNGIEGTTTNMCGLHRMPLDQAMHRLVILLHELFHVVQLPGET